MHSLDLVRQCCTPIERMATFETFPNAHPPKFNDQGLSSLDNLKSLRGVENVIGYHP